MKKALVLAIAAICMVAACKKSTVPTPEDESPVAVKFNTKTIDASVTKTKAPVTVWDGNQDLYIYGFEVQRNGVGEQIALGEGRYELSSPFIDGKTVLAKSPTSGNNSISVIKVGTEPYYYSTNTNVVYDFYAYYFGGADREEEPNISTTDQVSYSMEIDGTNDLMWATCNKENDVNEGDKTGNPQVPVVQTYQAYGAWAARRGVHPTLIFNHALTQFKFQIKRGKGGYSEGFEVTKIEILGSNKGEFIVVGEEPKYIATAVSNENPKHSFAHPYFDGTNGVAFAKTAEEATGYTEVGNCLMVAPDQPSVEVKFTMDFPDYSGDNTMTFEVSPESGNFLPGKSYTIKVIVYGPEAVNFDVTLTDWTDGGSVSYDPDEGNSAPQA